VNPQRPSIAVEKWVLELCRSSRCDARAGALIANLPFVLATLSSACRVDAGGGSVTVGKLGGDKTAGGRQIRASLQ
jgi:hypothetical protein